ncbi:DNA starvation/stationary phase protection protein [Carboxylicivirga sediminis]|uniref:DNA starvation/stationary phase protection protein n=1 Tax=Carboxylicivirga sediminis TaxID=2006564 RepID=A0A941F0V2_9BACT|nr:Dps family protein [Carboxylicivirga sediminis]MBR8534203.1 DNA starvation/stationary phase protection protein [Carboxylicivirga sediminis]
MKTINELLGLKQQESEQLTKELNNLLANYQLFYQNLRGFHWNVKGEKFFELHLKFEELYNDAVVKVDEIAERILTLGGTPMHAFSDYLEHAEIKTAKNKTNGNECMELTLDNMSTLIKLEKAMLPLAQEADDEGTITLLTDYISQQEKTIWMLHSWLSK